MPDPTAPHSGAPQPQPQPQPQPTSPFEAFPPPVPLKVVVADDNPVVRAGLTALLSGRSDITVVAEAADGRQAYEAALQHRPDMVLLDVRMPGVDGISALPYLVRIAPVVMLTYSRESEIVQEALRRGAGGYLVHGEFTADQLVAAVRDIKQGRAHFTPTAAGALLDQLRQGQPPVGGPLPEGLGQADATAYGNAASTSPYVHTEVPAPPGNFGHSPAPVSAISAENLSHMQPDMAQSSSGWTSGRPAAPDRSRFQLSTREAEIMDHIASGMNNQQIAATCFISEKTVKNHINRIFAKLHSTSRSEAAAKWLGTAPGSGLGVG
ncbi:response regulator transcription factor [Streptomyces sp. VMFN-G11Ma]|jgi:DNA-binding NarL/FixJ family response regulator|uniref:response regulator transcription factor n=1 Tax=Streptomyces sp. VMFN-G11Ma TaxID=2135609 RepID=UPI000D392489|nr:response regulator transcription factor [Streptomyces sp. VMFN-G11Ma]PTM91191.1 LuxR family two component transcriptional regulator [Streptomyces sp. VMFN-G11Ma]